MHTRDTTQYPVIYHPLSEQDHPTFELRENLKYYLTISGSPLPRTIKHQFRPFEPAIGQTSKDILMSHCSETKKGTKIYPRNPNRKNWAVTRCVRKPISARWKSSDIKGTNVAGKRKYVW
eukprot:scaffold22583_cov106-Cylindrotheca_fusiformis.AAC.25